MHRQHYFVSIGVPSLFLIFTVFCMVILSLLTYRTSLHDRIRAERSLEQTDNYLAACSQASDQYMELCDSLAEETSDKAFTQVPAEMQYTFAFSDTQCLQMTVLPVLSGQTLTLQITEWSTRITSSWNPDTHQNVFKKENTHE